METDSRIRTAFAAVLLTVCAANTSLNVLALLAGRLGALLPIAIAVLVIYEFKVRPPWGRITTKFYALVLILGGLTKWVLFIAGRGLEEPVALFVYRTLTIFAGVFILRYINIGMPLSEARPIPESKAAES